MTCRVLMIGLATSASYLQLKKLGESSAVRLRLGAPQDGHDFFDSRSVCARDVVREQVAGMKMIRSFLAKIGPDAGASAPPMPRKGLTVRAAYVLDSFQTA